MSLKRFTLARTVAKGHRIRGVTPRYSMSSSASDGKCSPGHPADFRTTHWSVVLLAGSGQEQQSLEALEQLCHAYWYPLYAFVRRRGYGEEEAKDLTQSFFAKLLEKNYVADSDRSRGKFRTFLLNSLSHFLANEWDKLRRQKRGGEVWTISLDADAEERYLHEPAVGPTPERVFDRGWAETVVGTALARLRAEFDREGAESAQRFDIVKPFLLGGEDPASCAVAAARLGISESGLRTVVHRTRKRFRELIRTQIAQTVSSPAEVDEEIHYLFEVLNS